MLSSLFSSTQIPVLEQVVNFSQARHSVLAGNIANLDTPGYRVRDLSPELFQDRLKAAIQAKNTPPVSSLGDPSRASALRGDPLRDVGKNMKSILRHDDGNVGLDQQVTAVTKNQMQHDMAIALLNSQFRLLQSAITERA